MARCLLISDHMRKPRRDTTTESGLFHKMWRGHNREHVLENNFEKEAYLKHLEDTFTDELKQHVQWYSFCLMGNHTHETGDVSPRAPAECDLKSNIQALGNWMRNAHSRFGAEYNRRHNRLGKVAYDRPKTTEVEASRLLQVMFYGDANPVRAGMVSHPSRYRYSSYRYYAYGESNGHTAKLTPPQAYLELGKTPKQRQRRYRQLCDDYLRREGLIDDAPSEEVEPLRSNEDSATKHSATQDIERTRGDPRSS